MFSFFFFFFQAEDGIRDYKVTGVQTCALPICLSFAGRHRGAGPGAVLVRRACRTPGSPSPAQDLTSGHARPAFRASGNIWGPGNIGEFLGPESEPAPSRTCLPAASACRPRMTVKNKKPSARKRSSSPADRKSTRLNSSHLVISYAVFCLKKKK